MSRLPGRPSGTPGARFLAAFVCVGMLACGNDGASAPLGPPSSAPLGPPSVVAAVDLGERAFQVAVGEGAVWATGGTQVWRFDPGSNRVTSTIRVEGGASSVATGEGAVWVTGQRALSRVDPLRDQVTGTVPLGAPRGVAVGHGSVWVADHSEAGVLRRINPRSLQIEATVKVPGLPDDTLDLAGEPTHVAVGAGGVWVADGLRGTASRLDPEKNVFTLTMSRLGIHTSDLAIGDDWLWMVNPSELARAKPGDRFAEDIAVAPQPVAVAIGRWAVWVVGSGDDTLSIVDVKRGKEALVGSTEETPVDVAVGFDSVWVLGRDGLLSRYTETGPTTSTAPG